MPWAVLELLDSITFLALPPLKLELQVYPAAPAKGVLGFDLCLVSNTAYKNAEGVKVKQKRSRRPFQKSSA